jgi:hypothetical protein
MAVTRVCRVTDTVTQVEPGAIYRMHVRRVGRGGALGSASDEPARMRYAMRQPARKRDRFAALGICLPLFGIGCTHSDSTGNLEPDAGPDAVGIGDSAAEGPWDAQEAPPADAPGGEAPIHRYVFTAFTNTSESNMYVYQSPNALDYTLIAGPAYTPPSELVRDPSVMKHSDGDYYVVYTTNWDGSTFGIAKSSDLAHWSFVRNVEVGVANVSHVWAPEWFKDPADLSVHVIVSIATDGSWSNFRPHDLTALDPQLASFGPAVPLAGIEPNYIDTFIVKVGGTYHNFSKNETTKYIEHGTASSLAGPYAIADTDDWAGWGKDLEGPALMRLAGGGFRIYMDAYATGEYFYSDSADLVSWSPKATLPNGLSGFVRHGTVLPE